MNNEDLQVLEHDHVIRQQDSAQRQARAATQAHLDASAEQDNDLLIGGVALVVTVRNARKQVADLTAQLHKLQEQHNDVTAVALSATATINALVGELAESTHAPLEAVKQGANKLRTEAYNAITDEWLNDGVLITDPREDPDVMEVRDWYVK